MVPITTNGLANGSCNDDRSYSSTDQHTVAGAYHPVLVISETSAIDPGVTSPVRAGKASLEDIELLLCVVDDNTLPTGRRPR